MSVAVTRWVWGWRLLVDASRRRRRGDRGCASQVSIALSGTRGLVRLDSDIGFASQFPEGR